jgi:hypothetical protein
VQKNPVSTISHIGRILRSLTVPMLVKNLNLQLSKKSYIFFLEPSSTGTTPSASKKDVMSIKK